MSIPNFLQRQLNPRPHPPRVLRRPLRLLQRHIRNLYPQRRPAPLVLALIRSQHAHHTRTGLCSQRLGRFRNGRLY